MILTLILTVGKRQLAMGNEQKTIDDAKKAKAIENFKGDGIEEWEMENRKWTIGKWKL